MEYFTNAMSIERAILSTYVYLDFFSDLNNPPIMIKLDEDLFSISLHKRIATKINKAISDNESISATCFEIQDKLGGTRYESEWLEILSSNSLPISTIPSYLKILTKIRIMNEYR